MEVFALEILKAPKQKNAQPLADFLWQRDTVIVQTHAYMEKLRCEH